MAITAAEVLEALEWLAQRGEVLIRKSPLLDGRMQVIWEAHREDRAGSISDSIEEALLATASELSIRERRS